MDYARELDQGIDRRMNISIAVTQGNRQKIVLEAIAAYIAFRREKRHPNQHSKELDTQARTWDELRKFEAIVKTTPQQLRLE
jgi:acyl-CoA hydrolase